MQKFKRMGVMNITPNSFSDGGEFFTPESIQNRLQELSLFEAIDIGAESTAPQNEAISWQEEWQRWELVLPFFKNLSTAVSADSYHPETIFELLKFWRDEKPKCKLIWNDVAGKFDEAVKDFLKSGNDYVFCHNLAPTRALSGRHMDFVASELNLKDYFLPYKHPQVIFDPCLGFSKSYQQNWWVLENFKTLQQEIGHTRWLIGFSRKSFLRQKFQTENRDELDNIHGEILSTMNLAAGELWVRTHRPELIGG
jgi:dihydropteroate synthase